MSVFAQAAFPGEPKTKDSVKVSFFYAVILVAFAVTQLFTFEEFLEYVPTLNLPISDTASYALAPILIVAEIFALPFLLRMRISFAFRYFSMFLGWVAAGLWILITFWLASSGSQADTVGFLGTLVSIMPGWWAVFISLALGILAAWSSWGLWPGKYAKKKK
jgi:hypothetical protein